MISRRTPLFMLVTFVLIISLSVGGVFAVFVAVGFDKFINASFDVKDGVLGL